MKLFSNNKKALHRHLIAFGDTEGNSKSNGLWSLSLLFKGVVTSEDEFLSKTSKIKFEKEIFHLLSFNSSTSNEAKTTSKSLKSHFKGLKYLQQQYKTSGIILNFWNASHDQRELKIYDSFNESNLYFNDMVKFAKNVSQFPSYKLSKLKNMYFAKPTEHTSLQDTLDMLNVLYMMVLDYNFQLKYNTRLELDDTVRKDFEKLDETKKLKMLINSDDFLIGLKQNQLSISAERKCSFDPEDLKYEYFKIDSIEFKVRKGFEDSNSEYFKGFGLYEKKYDTWHRVLKRDDKMHVLNYHIQSKKLIHREDNRKSVALM
jgi:hypothetical protein